LGLGVGLALLALVIIGGLSFWSTSVLLATAERVNHTHQVLEALDAVLSLLADAESGQRGFLLTRKDTYLKPYEDALRDIAQRLKDVRELTKTNAGQQRRLDRLEGLKDQRLALLREGIELRQKDESREDVDLQKAGGLKEVITILRTDKGLKAMQALRALVGEMEDEERRLLQERSDAAAAAAQATRLTIIVGTLAALAVLLAVNVVIARGITRPLGQLTEMSRKIAGGDLRHGKLEANSADEIGHLARASNAMLDGLRELAAQTAHVTSSLNAASAEILASTQEQAATTRQQAATVQQITTTMEEVSRSGVQISEKAKQVASSAEATSAAATQGVQAVRDTTQTMETIREQVEQVAENVMALSEKTQAVGEIIATVNDIAERSNLLALNAAIEAAGAGEQGSRFSVVANEMKNLADQAKDSTVQVRTILGDIQKGINSSVLLTEEAVKRVEQGKQKADLTEQTINQLVNTALESVQAFEQIIGANSQQQIGFEQVTQGMKDIRQAAGETAASVGQLEKALANLTTLGTDLQKTVGRYQL
jgi:methyl-accepting chemotaxis protein